MDEDDDSVTETETSAEGLGDIFVEQPADKGETDETVATETDESVDDTETKPKEETPSSTETTTDESDSVPRAALIAERRKRQQAEQRLQQQQDEDEKAKAPNPEDDPEGYRAWAESRNEQIAWTERAKFSRKAQMKLHDDYEVKETAFMDLVQDANGKVLNQALVDQMRQADDPGEFVYSYMSEYQEIQDWSDPEKRKAARDKMKAELKAELLKDLNVKSEGIAATDVPDLTTATATGKNTVQPIKEVTLTGVFD